jgi:hypothetical protein
MTDRVRLAYRDTDRSPMIYCIQAMAARHYDLEVEIVRIQGNEEFEASIFDGSADMICEHLEYLYQEVALGRHRATMFLCPVGATDGQLVVGPETRSIDDLRGKAIAVRNRGRPHAIAMQVRQLGLEGQVELLTVADEDVGRWAQWKTILTGECAGTFVPCLNIAPALNAGLRVLEVPQLEFVGHFGHACATDYAAAHDEIMARYVESAIHAICLLKLRRAEAMEIVAGEPARLMGLQDDRAELERQVGCIADMLQPKPYPSPAGVANTYEIGCAEWPGAAGINPLTLWDLHWIKQLDDEGVIDTLMSELSAR